MSKLFTFYNTEIEASELVSVYEKDEFNYELIWDDMGPVIRDKKYVDGEVKRGAFQIVEDFRNKGILFTFTPNDTFANHGRLYEVSIKDSKRYSINLKGNNSTYYFEEKEKLDKRVEGGKYEIVEDFRNQPVKSLEDVARDVIEKESKQGGIIWKMNNKKLPDNLFSISINHSINPPNRGFKTIREAIEYLQKLEEHFGEQ